MRRTLIAGNWKMNGSLAANHSLLAEIKAGMPAKASVDVLVCAPAPYLLQCAELLTDSAIRCGAQDVSAHAHGAFTGEVAASMLADCGCAYVIVGHSERRAYHAETNATVAQKVLQALGSSITPIVCVGETLEQRESAQTEQVVAQQLQAVLAVLAADQITRIVLAYEPVWAIGTGKTASPQMAQDVHAFLRAQVALVNPVAAQGMQILYGGSMKPDNAKDLLAMADIDGGLIGGAALKSAEFLAIIAACG
ncbi:MULTISPECIES: triose-phosphate isomerase [unclassified Undibacterium]|uniref:triose-phosphate isomerase n=2 Tax=Undibacterium TaxID=401469 RepID=UPI002AC90BF9|nr:MULTISPECIES: triose-phosphate isomerase [unclassified Undibacterium]MEB0139633.1 triose-phosphate isomerase [Undibacterium sp. CCC2.1]MEB0171989.1 triose-phosphate isomerase [Undibacterium sp. CCC1.1]MEB0176302.1 triose-phosphate isomerase [Undibacterium sp. CCC3.4]MEB0213984.1 triose-phosphate isomerase [Undibacterium sp. 5I2]WPX43600.1 triose-phosphate isomerase [Undibacterium sp. CCC3.4]